MKEDIRAIDPALGNLSAEIAPAAQSGGDASLKPAPALMAFGSIVGALAASSCCVLPLVLFSLGASGAWIGNLTTLAPYQPYFIATTIAFLGYGYWLVYRSSRVVCVGDACASAWPNRLVLTGLILATIVVVAASGFNLLAPLFLDS